MTDGSWGMSSESYKREVQERDDVVAGDHEPLRIHAVGAVQGDLDRHSARSC